MEARRRQSVQQTAPTNHQSLGGGFCTTSMEGWQHCNHLQERCNFCSLHSRQDLRQDPTQQTVYPHYTNGSSRDTMWLQRSTVDMIFCLRQLQERCIEQGRPLYMVFVDLRKAFDTVERTGLWQLLRKYGCPEKFRTMI